jgi:hypothetical protein
VIAVILLTLGILRKISSRPTLNDSFIQEPQGGIERAVATPTEPHYLMDMYFEFTHVRPMPTYSVPGLIDHF